MKKLYNTSWRKTLGERLYLGSIGKAKTQFFLFFALQVLAFLGYKILLSCPPSMQNI